MSWIIIEGLDRSGKSTVAEHYREQGFKIIHMLAPDKKYSQPGYIGPSYLDDLLSIYMDNTNKNIVFDRSSYGEFVWPTIYGRESQLTEEDVEALIEIENQNDAKRILMYDPNIEAHWQRCADNNEPLTRRQFNGARQLFDSLISRFGFKKTTLPNFLGTDIISEESKEESKVLKTEESISHPVIEVKNDEYTKLAQANAINQILSSRIIKRKGNEFDKLEKEVRIFLHNKLATLFGNVNNYSFTNEETIVLKEICKKVLTKQKGANL
jgi:thymidylate kinase